jgi:hypothetical protein
MPAELAPPLGMYLDARCAADCNGSEMVLYTVRLALVGWCGMPRSERRRKCAVAPGRRTDVKNRATSLDLRKLSQANAGHL